MEMGSYIYRYSDKPECDDFFQSVRTANVDLDSLETSIIHIIKEVSGKTVTCSVVEADGGLQVDVAVKEDK